MPLSNRIRRVLLQTIADNINEVIVGFDGTPATSDDGSAGRPAVTLTPKTTIVDDSTLLVEAKLERANSFTENIKEVYIQYRGSDSFTPVARYTTKEFLKSENNEVKIEILIEVA
jgi:hypothetical protein